MASAIKNRVGHSVTCIRPDAARHLSPGLVLRRLQRFPSGAESPARLDDEEVAQVELASRFFRTELVDQALGARDDARRREQLHRHVREALELLLSVDDL